MGLAEARRISPLSNAGAILFLVWSVFTIFARKFDTGFLEDFQGSLLFIRIFSIEVPFDLIEFFFRNRVGVFAIAELYFVAIIVVSILGLTQKKKVILKSFLFWD